MKALVTGGAGFVGRHVIEALKDRGYSQIVTVDTEPMAVDMDLRRPAHLHVIQDALEYLTRYTIAFDLVVHCAAASPHRAAIDSQPATHIRNQLLDAALFDWAVRTGPGRVLYLSSCAALDDKPDAYGQLKLTGERMARQARAAGVPVTIVRPYSGYGEDQGEDWPFGAFIARAKRREDPFVIWGDGTQVRDWIHIDDVVAGMLAVAESGTTDPANLCTGVGTSMLDLVRLVSTAAGYEPEIKLRTDRPAGVAYRVGDPSRLHQYYKPQVTIAEGVDRAFGGTA